MATSWARPSHSRRYRALSAKRTSLALAALAGAVLIGASSGPDIALAAKPCGKVKAATGGKARVAAYKTNCQKARKVAVGYYKRRAADPMDWDGMNPKLGIFYRVGGYKCFTGLGGSQAFCMVGKRRVLASTRPEDRPAKWL
jgi:hypothetical protein